MNTEIFTEPVSKVYQALDEMADNIVYIRRELPSLEMSDEIRAAMTGMCNDFDSALYDVRKEVRTLEDKLGMHPGGEPFDPNVTNPDPKVTLSLMRTWLQREMEALHGIVTKLQAVAEREPTTGIVFVLVAESGANILQAFGTINDKVDLISANLDEAQNA